MDEDYIVRLSARNRSVVVELRVSGEKLEKVGDILYCGKVYRYAGMRGRRGLVIVEFIETEPILDLTPK